MEYHKYCVNILNVLLTDVTQALRRINSCSELKIL